MTAPYTPKSQPLTTNTFANKMQALHEAGANDMKYLALSEYLTRTGNLLDIDMSELPLGYSDKADSAVGRVNNPVMGRIYESVARSEVQEYAVSLTTLPTISNDQDYKFAAEAMMRAVGARIRTATEFPGFKDAWQDFFNEQLRPVFNGLPNMVTESDRKLLFEALASVISGKITHPELNDYEDFIEAAHEQFIAGTVESFADALYALTAEMVEIEPPEPPCDSGNNTEGEDAEPNGDDGEDRGEGKGDKKDSNPESGYSDQENESNGDDKPQDGNDSDQTGDDSADEQDGEADNEANNDDADSDEEDNTSDPFEKLASYIRNVDPENSPPPTALGAEEMMTPDKVDFDPDSLAELRELEADITIPEAFPSLEALYFKAPVAPGAKQLYKVFQRTYRSEVNELISIVDEFYRVKTIHERGLLSGRADGARLYKARFGSRDVFKRAHVDSVGHLDMRILLDESGSMCDRMPSKLPNDGAIDSIKDARYSDGIRNVRGDTLGRVGANRANLARQIGFMLTEASKNLEGFNVSTYGYTGLAKEHLPENLRPLHKATAKLIKKHGGSVFMDHVPIIRKLADKEQPWSIMSCTDLNDNGDLQALAWTVQDMIRNSKAEQKAIVFVADGMITGEEDLFDDIIKQAEQANIYIHFMDLSEGAIPENSSLNKLPKHEVTNFKDMRVALTHILNHLASNYL